mmetsp:Transcript_19115/g.73074  ORF Transcript_19115/g.73074 Transcript_19115/m.73074 type:complete len:229 (-) Transcript_19115:36-722(-)
MDCLQRPQPHHVQQGRRVGQRQLSLDCGGQGAARPRRRRPLRPGHRTQRPVAPRPGSRPSSRPSYWPISGVTTPLDTLVSGSVAVATLRHHWSGLQTREQHRAVVPLRPPLAPRPPHAPLPPPLPALSERIGVVCFAACRGVCAASFHRATCRVRPSRPCLRCSCKPSQAARARSVPTAAGISGPCGTTCEPVVSCARPGATGATTLPPRAEVAEALCPEGCVRFQHE